jgi:hypothetical protein
LIAKQVHSLRLTSRPDSRQPHGIVLNTQPAGLVRRQFEVQPEFLFQVAVAPAEMQCAPKTLTPLAKRAQAFHRHPSLCSSVWMMPAMRSHACFSFSS